MSTIGNVLMLVGGMTALLAGVGILRLRTSYARFHAAGKASPVAFLVTALGAGFVIGSDAVPHLTIASAAMILTLPVGVHLLYRAVHRTSDNSHLLVDHLAPAESLAE